jgi:hypothetical protein
MLTDLPDECRVQFHAGTRILHEHANLLIPVHILHRKKNITYHVQVPISIQYGDWLACALAASRKTARLDSLSLFNFRAFSYI